MKPGILSIVITISMAFGFFSIVKMWFPIICSDIIFLKIGMTVLIVDVLLISLWAIRRKIRDEENYKNGKYSN
jgi:tetrahydromethanopterin S-methyltransferase subunit E